MTDDLARRSLELVSNCIDPTKLRQIAENARRASRPDVERAALLHLYAILPAAEPGTLEHDVWQSIFALEDALKKERGKTVLLSRTRQKIARDGEHKTVADLIKKRPSEGFRMLIERDMPELTFEAVALRHPAQFQEGLRRMAENRLRDAGFAPAPAETQLR